MRFRHLLLAVAMWTMGCTHMSLERNTLNQISTISDLRYQEALDNLAVLASNPASLPFYSVISAGTTQVSDTGQLSSSTMWTRMGFDSENLGLQANRNLQENWTLDPVHDPEKLEAMRCASLWTLGAPESQCGDCAERLNHFKVMDKLARIRPGWLQVGGKKDVPRFACRSSHCGAVYVWVTPDGLEGLTQFTLILLDIATVDLNSLDPDKPTKTVTTENYRYGDPKNPANVTQVIRVTETVDATTGEPVATPGGAAPTAAKARIRYQELDANLRSLINLRR